MSNSGTSCIVARQAYLSSTLSRSLLRFMSIESMMLPNHLILCCPLLLFLQHQGLSTELALHIRWPKYWSFSNSPSNEYSGLISFRIDYFDLLAVQGTLQEIFSSTTVQSINSLALSLLYGPTLISIHDYWKNHSFEYMDLCLHSNVSAFEYAI